MLDRLDRHRYRHPEDERHCLTLVAGEACSFAGIQAPRRAFGTILAGDTSRKPHDRRLADARKDGWPCLSRRYSSLGYDGGKLQQVTQKHYVRWQCPTCGCTIEQLVLPNTITPLMCPARNCHQGFQMKGDEVFVAEPL